MALSQLSVATKGGGRRLALIDRNRDLYVTPTEGVQEMVKLHTMVDTVAWNEENGSLAAMADGHFVVWYYPECASPQDFGPSSHPLLYLFSTPSLPPSPPPSASPAGVCLWTAIYFLPLRCGSRRPMWAAPRSCSTFEASHLDTKLA